MSMEFLLLSRSRSSARNVPSGEECGETDVFAGYYSSNLDSTLFEIQTRDIHTPYPLPLSGPLVHHVNIKTDLILSFSRWKSSAYNVRGVSFKLCIYDIQMVPFL